MKRVNCILAGAALCLAGACAKHEEASSRGDISLLGPLNFQSTVE